MSTNEPDDDEAIDAPEDDLDSDDAVEAEAAPTTPGVRSGRSGSNENIVNK